MQLYAALVPPRETREELAALVRGVRLPAPVDTTPGRHRGDAGRLGALVRRRPAPAPGPAPSTEGMLSLVAPEDLRIHVASFGNLNHQDAQRLASVLTDAAADWPAPRLRVRGGTALDWPGDVGVWARLDGDVDPLEEIARAVPGVAQRLRLYIDRRRFRPLLRLGSITDDTTVPYLEQLLADLEAHTGSWWDQQTLPLLQLAAGSPDGRLRPFGEVPLGGSR